MDADFSMFQDLLNNSKGEEGVAARFYDRSVKTSKIDDNGMPVFENVTYVEIRIKDNNTDVYDQPADKEKIRRFPLEYQRYQLERKQIKDGTPLNQFAFLDAAQIDTLKVRGIFTVETLAELPEEKAVQLNVVREHELAAKFLANAKDNKVLLEWQEQEKTYQDEIKKLQEEIAALKAHPAGGALAASAPVAPSASVAPSAKQETTKK